MQTDPVGVTFVLARPPLGQDPGVEVWKGEEGEDGWNRAKMEKEVLEVAKEDGCSAEQLAEWKALFSFHEEHKTADSLPALPTSLTTEAMGDSSFTLTGMPIEWKELWSKLAGRFPRPHHTAATSGEQGTGAPASAAQHSSGAADVSQNTSTLRPAAVQLPLPLHNSVTGLNYQPAVRQHATMLFRRRTEGRCVLGLGAWRRRVAAEMP
eukprot:6211068-Pleurochrysis_carterae.AAC.1